MGTGGNSKPGGTTHPDAVAATIDPIIGADSIVVRGHGS